VVVAVGHTDADDVQARAAFDRGARLLTHTFNAMAPLHHRAPGPVGAALDDERITLEVIADGHHVHPSVVRLLYRQAPGRVALVTDAMAAACCGDGQYRLGEVDVQVVDGCATVAGTDRLAGSTITQDVALRNAIQVVGLAPEVAVASLTATPARVLGLEDRFGALREGCAADLVMLDADWAVTAVWTAGHRTT
jgi:N-acetylglucosamine-6-phosphate deacetylase